jgi:hypothetical protein
VLLKTVHSVVATRRVHETKRNPAISDEDRAASMFSSSLVMDTFSALLPTAMRILAMLGLNVPSTSGGRSLGWIKSRSSRTIARSSTSTRWGMANFSSGD